MENLLIIGCGDVARRALPELQRRYRVTVLVRSPDPALAPRGRGAMLPRGFAYLSTSGDYGNRAGEWVDETA